MERVAGIPILLGTIADLDVWFPLSDDRGALLVEAWQRGWGGQVTLDALAPGAPSRAGPFAVRTVGLPDGDRTVMGISLESSRFRLAYLPQTTHAAAARRWLRGADLVVLEAGFVDVAGLDLPPSTELWLPRQGTA